MELVDTHCHLFMSPMGDEAAATLERARAAGVRQVVVPSYDRNTWPRVAELTREHEGVFAAFGAHPWVAEQRLDPDRLRELLGWGRAAWAMAVGEIGLDYALRGANLERQRETLGRQLDLALEFDKPVILHCRRAADDLEAMVRARPGLRGVVHGFSRGPELAERFVRLGLMVSFGPLVTHPGAHRARRAAAHVPGAHLLLETDAPTMPLADLPEQEVEPCHAIRVAEALAELRGETVEAIAAQTTDNARVLFGLPN